MDLTKHRAKSDRRMVAINRILKRASQPGSAIGTLFATWVPTPLGHMLAVADRARLHLLEFADRKALPREIENLQRVTRSSIEFGTSPPLRSIATELKAYFAGASVRFRTPIAQSGSVFSLQVWRVLSKIKPGATKTYAQLAAAAGRPSAIRAAGRANGANVHTIVVPCHRVVGSDGSLTGYGGGLWRKRWLLDHERYAFV
ncbi:MAG: methylated-DNA--[protein]-cysteine S-methyltransferase [Alphaproteobacteria bacterium]|nr:methylated-DNA--[protein]-cysteine S-methyltransferase [Alphaproteobacteria bacterium]